MTDLRFCHHEPDAEPHFRVGPFYAFMAAHRLILGMDGYPSIEVPPAALAPLSDLAGRLASEARKS